MKTPRDLLFGRHRPAESRLDAVRETALARLAAAPDRNASRLELSFSLRECLLSLRWHFTALGAAWLAIVFLNVDMARSPGQGEVIAREKTPSAQIILTALRENRRQLLEMIGLPEARDAAPPKTFPPRPRSEQRNETLAA